jgi:hypothetical protein
LLIAGIFYTRVEKRDQDRPALETNGCPESRSDFLNTTKHTNPQQKSLSRYSITVKGTITDNWKDWFNGMLINYEQSSQDGPQTTITCRVRDQAELNGILNWLFSMSLTLVKVIKIDP